MLSLNIRNKILFLFILISIIPLALFAVLGGYFINLAQNHSIAQLESQLIGQKEKEIEKFFTDIHSLFKIQIALPIASLGSVPEDQREFLLKEIAASNRNIEKLSFLEYDSVYADKLENGMELNKLENGIFSAELSNQNNSPQFQVALKGDSYFGSVYQKGNDFLMTVAAPVKNKDGILIGIMSGEISLRPIIQSINNAMLGSSGYLLLADDRGVVWARPSQLKESGFGSNVFVLSVLGGEYGGVAGQIQEYQSTFGDLVMASGKRLNNVGWALIAEWPKNDAYAIVYSIINQGIIYLILIFSIAVIAALLFATRITKPIKILDQGAKIIGHGDFAHRIQIQSKDELQDLAERFNEMAKNLKDIGELRETQARMEGLSKSLEKEKELSQIKDKFIATASHQLRTPVSVIRWLAESMRSAVAQNKMAIVESQLDDLYKNMESLALVIGDILTIAELGIGYQPAFLMEFSLKKEAEEAIGRFRKEAEEKNISLNFKPSDEKDDYKISASLLNIRRAMEHLLANAVTYTKKDGNILVELSRAENKIEFSVKDDGIGVLPEDQKLIFGEFARGKNSVEMKNVGTGLGLFIVKTIIEGHKGEIGVESPAVWKKDSVKSKLGSRFYFFLPSR